LAAFHALGFDFMLICIGKSQSWDVTMAINVKVVSVLDEID